MHGTAMEFGAVFFKAYAQNATGLTILDIGSQDVNGSLRSVAPEQNTYIGIDFMEAKGVDVVITDPYALPFEDNTADIIVSSSCFEHAEFFWLLFNEAMRLLKPNGLLYINAPSNGDFHRYPLDCWRFYPDSGIALQNWGQRNGYPCALIESCIGHQKGDIWNDFIAVFIKDQAYIETYTLRIQHLIDHYNNGHLFGTDAMTNLTIMSEDQRAHHKLKSIIHSVNQILGQ